jgi:hypothetical protein
MSDDAFLYLLLNSKVPAVLEDEDFQPAAEPGNGEGTKPDWPHNDVNRPAATASISPILRAHPRSHRSGGIDAAMRLAYRVQQVGNGRIVTPLLQPGRANRAKEVRVTEARHFDLPVTREDYSRLSQRL